MESYIFYRAPAWQIFIQSVSLTFAKASQDSERESFSSTGSLPGPIFFYRLHSMFTFNGFESVASKSQQKDSKHGKHFLITD